MPNINNNTIFKNDLFIPLAANNITTVASQQTPNNNAALEAMITLVEKDILLNVNGLTFYNDLQTALADLPASDQKWQDLVNGVEYDGKIWEGLNNSNNLLAYATYYHFNSRNVDFYTSVGMAKPNSENATQVNHTQKLVSIWQTFLYKYQKANCLDYFRHYTDVNVSLYQYLTDKAVDFDFTGSKFKLYKQINSLGL